MLSSILILINSIISKKNFLTREKPSVFECGFDPKSSARISFSLQFYLISIIFLIFDVEITLIIPIPIIFKIIRLNQWIFISIFFLFILIIGLYYEWNEGALNWKK